MWGEQSVMIYLEWREFRTTTKTDIGRGLARDAASTADI